MEKHMTAQWVLLARTTVSTATTAVEFTSIGSYESYRVIGYTGDNGGSDYLSFYPNNSNSNLISRGFYANTTSGNVVAHSHSRLHIGINANNNSTDLDTGCSIADIGFAQSTTIVKPLVSLGGWAGNMLRFGASAWNVTGTALSSIYIKVGSDGTSNFRPNTVIALYGRNV
jgi:hypothetical protein